jgi:hypothetical protein
MCTLLAVVVVLATVAFLYIRSAAASRSRRWR